MQPIIFCDFDGVIRHWDNTTLFEQEAAFQLPKGTTFKVAFSAELLLPAVTGKVKDEVWRNQVFQKLSQSMPNNKANSLIQAWSDSPATIDHDLLDTLKKMLPNSRIALVTNATSRLNQDLAGQQMDEAFNFVINSSEIGVAKPEIDFYRQAVQMTEAKIEVSLFIDDSQKNVQAAESFGLKGFHYSNLQKLQEELKQWLSTTKR